MVSCGLYFFCHRLAHGCSTILDASLATTRSLNSSSTRVLNPTDLFELRLRFLAPATFDHRVGYFRKDQRSNGDYQGRDHGSAQAQTPSPTAFDLGKEVVELLVCRL
ncbi:hypothetical protein RHGRI_017665 [Rhododendron griersonianum]|uniref:Secreted protein n=1 Tax=Rhododendron griersonianum TaxID=479676 RepID=A0AAV6JYQ7_9ERIC|nr:hypothetical protein RHGRI_017665 [Rhododendron griersonianum]